MIWPGINSFFSLPFMPSLILFRLLSSQLFSALRFVFTLVLLLFFFSFTFSQSLVYSLRLSSVFNEMDTNWDVEYNEPQETWRRESNESEIKNRWEREHTTTMTMREIFFLLNPCIEIHSYDGVFGTISMHDDDMSSFRWKLLCFGYKTIIFIGFRLLDGNKVHN